MSEGWADLRVGEFHLEVHWQVQPGEVLALFGPSGSGKSLTLQVIAGLLYPKSGRVEVDGVPLLDTDKGVRVAPHGRRIGYVPQQYGLFPHLSVQSNIAFGLARWTAHAARSRTQELLEAFHLESIAGRRPRDLSGGEQQRVAFARALAPQPRLLLLDEPFSALDAELRRDLRREVRARLRQWHLPVILVTHDRDDVLALAHRVVVLDGGRVVAEGEPLSVLGQPRSTTVARLVGLENVLEGWVEEVHPQEGTMICRVGPLALEAPLVPGALGRRVQMGLRASDIIVAVQRPQGISARNILPGRVTTVQAIGHEREVQLDCGVPLRARLTPGSVSSLNLAPGREAWAVIKASALVVLEEP